MPGGRYGVDAPGLVRSFLVVGLAFGSAGFALHHWAENKTWPAILAGVLYVGASYAIFMCGYMLWGSLVAKVRGREAILDLISWTGDERVLDVGCGRGLLLIGAAHRLTRGEAIGLDLWIQRDQSSNQQAATLRNAAVEGVADRVHVVTGDMRDLPFTDASFDVVLSSWAVHNLESKEDRDNVLESMVRVLRPGGSLLLNDIENRDEYQMTFMRLGLKEVRVVVASKWADLFSGAVSFGAFRPATVMGRKSLPEQS